MGVVAVAAGPEHYLAISADGALFGWGYSICGGRPVVPHDENQLDLLPRQVELPADDCFIVRIAAGFTFSVVASRKGTVYTFGSNTHGALGLGVARSDDPEVRCGARHFGVVAGVVCPSVD